MKAGSVLDGKYELRRCIGDGATGVVWEGVNVRTEREVAVKILVDTGKQEDRERFLREARAGGRIRHGNVVDVYDVAETDTGTPFIVMELLKGETLADRMERGALPLAQSVRILRDVGRGLTAAHKAGVVHRDLKPHNVFLHVEADSDVPTVKLVEFGISRIATEATLTVKGTAIGSPGYIAPEQVYGRSVDGRADIWAFGVVAYELFLGLPLFNGTTAAEIVQQVIASRIPELPPIAPELDVDLRALVGGCLVREAAMRFQTIIDCVTILDRILSKLGQPAMAAIASRPPSSAADDDGPTTVANGELPGLRQLPKDTRISIQDGIPEPRTERRNVRSAMPSDSDEHPVPTLLYKRADLKDEPDTAPEISIHDGSPISFLADLRSTLTNEVDDGPVDDDTQPETLANPPTADDAQSASDPPPSVAPPDPRRSLTDDAPTRVVLTSLEAPADEPSRESQMFKAAIAPENGAVASAAARGRLPLVAVGIVVAVLGGIGILALTRSSSAPAAPDSSPTSVASTIASTSATTSPPAVAASNTDPLPSSAPAPSAAPSASVQASASASASTGSKPPPPPHVISHPTYPPPPISAGAGPTYNPPGL